MLNNGWFINAYCLLFISIERFFFLSLFTVAPPSMMIWKNVSLIPLVSAKIYLRLIDFSSICQFPITWQCVNSFFFFSLNGGIIYFVNFLKWQFPREFFSSSSSLALLVSLSFLFHRCFYFLIVCVPWIANCCCCCATKKIFILQKKKTKKKIYCNLTAPVSYTHPENSDFSFHSRSTQISICYVTWIIMK